MVLPIIRYRTLWLTIAALITIVSIVAIPVFGIRLGIDFTGGSLVELRFVDDRPELVQIEQSLKNLSLEDVRIQPSGSQGLIIRLKPITEVQHQQILSALQTAFPGPESIQPSLQVKPLADTPNGAIDTGVVEVVGSKVSFNELRFESIGPSVGAELRQRAITATILALIAIIGYIAWSFRKVSRPVSSWWYGLIAIAALLHDVLFPLGVFAIAGRWFDLTLDSAAIAALLTILGYSVNDTIVVFDRTREELIRRGLRDAFAETVNRAVNQTLARSLNTTLTTLLPLLMLFAFGGASIRSFVLMLTIGIASGAYSSIFIASPLLVVVERWQAKK